MKHLFTLLFGLLAIISSAQIEPLKPSDLVLQHKSLKSNFQEVTLFNKLVNINNTDVPNDLKNYELLSLDIATVQSFNNKFPSTINLNLPTHQSNIMLELVQVSVTTDDFQAIEMPSGKPLPSSNATHYRGIVKGQPNSLVAISIYNNNVSGFISTPNNTGTIVIGPLENSDAHVLYEDRDLSHLNNFSCEYEDDTSNGYTLEEISSTKNEMKNAQSCVRVFFDISTDVVNNKGGAQQASNYIEAVFNQVAALYANDQISISLSGTKAWTTTTPFNTNNLDSYMNYRNSNAFNGDLGHLVNYSYNNGNGGGLAGGIGTLCNSNKNYAVSGIKGTYQNIPTYSFDVFLIAHELGHNVGSKHTHACAWNGNNTAIDGCAGYTEGNCSQPGNPSGGGTIMSYCANTSVGVNLNLGFGSQPRNVIQNYINGRTCLQTCSGGGDCTDTTLQVTFTNNSDCILEYYQNNTLEGTANAGDSFSINAATGSLWEVRKASGEVFDNFTIDCNITTYTSSGTCSSDSGTCDGVNPYSPYINYTVGDRVTYNGNLYELTTSGWQNLGPCTTNNDPCDGVNPWSPYINYPLGAKVTYNGSLYQLTYSGWQNLGPCGTAFINNERLDTALSFSLYPNPANDILNVEIKNTSSSDSQISIIDLNGRVLKTYNIETPQNGFVIKRTLHLNSLSNGVYFVKITSGPESSIKKIIIK